MVQRFGRTVRRHWIAALALFLALGGTSAAVASGRPAGGGKTYYACVTKTYRTLNLTTASGRCGSGETKISFAAKGPRGLRGVAGRNGTSGKDGANGKAGGTGPQGAAGAKGDAGPKGEGGAKGETGPQGDHGAKGDTGATGADGPQGEKGEQGDVGPQGLAGIQGIMGLPGPIGPEGPLGPTGPIGPIGPTGGDGPQGEPGPVGETGPKGDIGPAGATGAAGPIGPVGPQGDEGPKGATGSTGPAGSNGSKGDKGDKGDAGPAGPAGPAGAGAGVTLRDGNGVTLGRVLNATETQVFVLTSAGYQVTLAWTGALVKYTQLYYSGTCASPGTTTWLNSGNSQVRSISGRQVVYSTLRGTLMAPKTVGADGTSTSGAMAGQSGESPSTNVCTDSATPNNTGFEMQAITRAAVGLPSTIATPLSLN
jgi:hypothetical protein